MLTMINNKEQNNPSVKQYLEQKIRLREKMKKINK